MNDIVFALGIESWKPVLAALLLPPVPFLVLILVGARLMFRRRLLAWLLVLLGTVSLYLLTTSAAAYGLTNWLLQPPRALSTSEIADLKRAPKTAIVVLGGGTRSLAPEYGVASLTPRAMERLRYALWLSRETGLPVGFSGGVGHGATPGPSEAEIAARIAERDFARPLRWLEGDSRDTRENAIKTIALLQTQGIDRIVLVTEGYHMRRALRNFERAAEGRQIRIVAAPMGMPPGGALRGADWLPNRTANEQSSLSLHEWLGLLAGS